MNEERLLKHLVLLMFFIFILDILARQFYWYYSVWYFDILMHFLSGFWVGLFFLYAFYSRNIFSKKSLTVILYVLVIGILWEVFEFYVHNYMGQDPFNTLDTITDIFLDLLGGVSAVWYFSKRIMLQSKDGPLGNSL